MKRLFKRFLACAAAAVLVFAGLSLPAFADDTGYEITAYSVDATLHENNTITQTETITVHYNEYRHGIFRALPELVYVWRTVGDERVKMGYRVKIKDVNVTGAPYDTSSEDDVYYIRIGDEDETVIGDMTYTISFVYDIGDDRMEDYDELYYSFNGPDWDTTISNFNFALHFDKALPEESVQTLALYSGAYGSTGNDEGIEYTLSANSIEGKAPGTLPSGSAVTVHTRLPEGYFTGERHFRPAFAWAALALMAVAAAYTVLRILRAKHRKPVATVEFYPPEGINSADVGYIVDGSADDRDIISLVIWLADKGYLTIAEGATDKVLVLNKVKSVPNSLPNYVRTFFNALFPGSETRRVLGDVSTSAFYTGFGTAKTELDQYYSVEKRQMYRNKGLAFLLPLACALAWGLFAALACCYVEFYPAVFIIMALVAMAGTVLFSISADGLEDFASASSRIWHRVLPLLTAGAALLCATGASMESLLGGGVVIYTSLVPIVCCLLAPRLIEETDFRIEMAGKLLGLRNFIKQAELPRLKLLVEEDPAYFYSVLPYAYVFGLSKKWAEKFETLAVAPPSWYVGDAAFSYLWFDHTMRHGLDSSLHEIHTATSNSGSGGNSSWGSSGGGGGGFSGGGFGGGGGGSW